MAYNANELYGQSTVGAKKRIYATSIQPKTFAAGSGTIEAGTPVYYDKSSGLWKVINETALTGANAVVTITAASTTATAGTFDLYISVPDVANPILVAGLDHAVSTAALNTAIDAAFLAQAGITLDAGDVVVAEAGGGLDANDGTCTLTFAGRYAEAGNVHATLDVSGLTGNAHTVAVTTPGAAGARVDGILWPDPVALDTDEEVLGQVMLAGRVHIDDLVTPSTVTDAQMRSAMADPATKPALVIVEGLPGSR
jgi:hypothetical protein